MLCAMLAVRSAFNSAQELIGARPLRIWCVCIYIYIYTYIVSDLVIFRDGYFAHPIQRSLFCFIWRIGRVGAVGVSGWGGGPLTSLYLGVAKYTTKH